MTVINGTASNAENQKTSLYIVGVGIKHTIAPDMHNYITKTLGLPWTFSAEECPTVEDALALFQKPTFAGGVVTMPYKKSIMSHLDELDDLALSLGACNNVYLTPEGKLRGTNTDWRGVRGALENGSAAGRGKPALIIGAGGACRAAVYALNNKLECPTIYVINRDVSEVEALLEDVKKLETPTTKVEIVHLKSTEQARRVPSPFYIVGTIPDFEPQSEEELLGRDMLEAILSGAEQKGVLLDMCFKPRITRNIKMARNYDWQIVEGIEIIGHQITEQYRLWAGEDASRRVPTEDAWKVLRQSADKSTAINF